MLTGFQGRFQCVSFLFLLGLAAGVFLGSMSAKGDEDTPQAMGKPPHGDAERCTACHASDENGVASTLLFEGNVTALCQSCHDGETAPRELHPVDVSASEHTPSEFPLKEGRMTCLTCHDMAKACETDVAQPFFLRGRAESKRAEFCAHCHDAALTRPFNVHDQVGARGVKTDTCLWCHIGPWQTDTPGYKNPVYLLRPYDAALCENCHAVAPDHPAGEPHMHASPSEDMMWFMAATEMRYKMKLPFKDLLSFVKAAGRKPRTMPLDAQARITCYTCHNPHETGVIKASSPRALGAEPKQARHDRLRASKNGQMCQACHNI